MVDEIGNAAKQRLEMHKLSQ